MPTDCTELSPAAQAIFAKLEPFFPPDPWKRPCWFADGQVIDNGKHDLRKAADRKQLKERYEGFIGYSITLDAGNYRAEHGSLEGFTEQRHSQIVSSYAERILLLKDLDFQIETQDFVDSL